MPDRTTNQTPNDTTSPSLQPSSRHSKQLLPYNDNKDDRHGQGLEEDESNFIEPLFQIALHIVQSSFTRSSTIQPTYNDKLILYSLFKQSVRGDVKNLSISRPGMFDMLGRAKWDAWKSREGLSSTEAKKLYLDCVLNILRSHQQSPEAKGLMEMLSSYEAYSAMTDQFSESDEDLNPEHNILAASSSSQDRLNPNAIKWLKEGKEEEVEREKEEVQLDGNKSKSEDFRSFGLGPYVTSAQLPDPVDSPKSQIFPPDSLTTEGDTGSGSFSKSINHSISIKNESFTQQRSLIEESRSKKLSIDEAFIGSERRFTDEQVQRLVHERSPDDEESSNGSPQFSHRKRQNTFSGNGGVIMNSIDLENLNQSIKHLENTLSKFESNFQLLKRLLNQVPLTTSTTTTTTTTNNNDNEQDPANSNQDNLHLFKSSFLNRFLSLFFFKFSFKHFLFDLSIIFILFKFFKFKKNSIRQNLSKYF